MSDKNTGFNLVEADKLIERGYARITENAGKIIALITGLVAALVIFTEVGFGGFDSEGLTPVLAVMLISSYVIYFSMEDAGERYARGCEEYKEAKGALDRARERVSGEMMPAFRRFCLEYSREERERRIKELLISGGYGLEEYEAYKRGKATPKGAARLFRRADRIGCVRVSPSRMLSIAEASGTEELYSPEGRKLFGMLLKLLPTTLCMLVTVSVILTGRENMGFAEITEGILRLSTLPVVAMRGYIDGYSYVSGPLCSWLEARARFIEVFLVREGKESCAHSESNQ